MSVDVDVFRDLEIPMRDGVLLRADVYLPARRTDPVAALLTRTAYGKDGFFTRSADYGRLAAAGYAVVVQDKRGRFRSDGEYRLLHDDGVGAHRDGFDTVEWIAAQPWCDGRVGAFGLSYLGHTTMGAAIAQPPHLIAGVSMQPSTDEYIDRTFLDGVLMLSNTVDWASGDLVAPSLIDGLPPERRAEVRAELDEYLAGDRYDRLPLQGWPFFRSVPTLFDDSVAHREDPEFFAESRIGEAEAAAVEVPILHLGGWYDFFTRNSVRQFELTSRLSPAGAQQLLVMGPWSHGMLALDTFEGVAFPGSAVDSNAIVLDWMRRTMDTETDAASASAALIYVMGANRWRAEPTWPIPATDIVSWHLGANGALERDTPSEGSRDYRYDPAEPYTAPAAIGGPKDVSSFQSGDDILLYTSEPLSAELEITGWPRAVLHAASTATDTDWLVELHIVDVDGVPRLIDEGIARARYRAGREDPQPVTPGAVEEYVIDLRPTSIVLHPGERLRVAVTSGKFPVFERNPNRFMDLNTVTESDFEVAVNTIHAGAGLSRVELPIVPTGQGGRWIDTPWPFTPLTPTPVDDRGEGEHL